MRLKKELDICVDYIVVLSSSSFYFLKFYYGVFEQNEPTNLKFERKINKVW
jgi:hypothetical protein